MTIYGRAEDDGDAAVPGGLALHYLRTFHLVATLRSFTRAGEALHLTQPAVSAHIRALERYFGTSLFVIRHRRPYLTAEAEALLEFTTRIFNLVRDAERAVAETMHAQRGRLRLAASHTIGTYLLPEILARFAARHPGVEVEVIVETTREVMERVLSAGVAVGLVEVPVSHPDVEIRPFGGDEVVLVASPNHPLAGRSLALTDLAKVPLVRREAGAMAQQFVDAILGESGVVMPAVLVISGPEALKQAVLHGIGLAWLSRVAVERELAAGDLVAVTVPGLEIHRPLSLLTSRDVPLSAAANAFAELVLAGPWSGASPAPTASAD